MTFLIQLAEVLRAAGCKVVEVDGWKTRGRPASTGGFAPVGVLIHHTGGAQDGYAYATWLAKVGRSDLPAPLCQLSLGRDGTWYVCAAGRANHAGQAKASGTVSAGDGNTLYVGVECQNTGTEGWSSAQYDALVLGTAAVSNMLKTSANAVRGHRETSVTGKWDPGKLDLDKFRADVAAKKVALAAPKPEPAPAPDTTPTETVRVGLQALDHRLPLAKIREDVVSIVKSGAPVTVITEAIKFKGIEGSIKAAAHEAGGTYVAGGRGDTGFILGPGVSAVRELSTNVHAGRPGPGSQGGYAPRDVDSVTINVPSVGLVTILGVHPVTGWWKRLTRRKLVEQVLRAAVLQADAAGRGGRVAFIAGDFNINFRSGKRGPLSILDKAGYIDNWTDRGGAEATHGSRTYDAVFRRREDRRVSKGKTTLVRRNSDHRGLSVAYEARTR